MNPRESLQSTVLSGLVNAGVDTSVRFAAAERSLRSDHFSGELRPFWTILTRYYSLTGSVPSLVEFDELLSASVTLSLEERERLHQQFESILEEEISQARFTFSVFRLRERVRDEDYAGALAVASNIHLSGDKVDGKELAGYDDSVEFLTTKMAKIADLDVESAEGNINEEGVEILQSYHDARAGDSTGILTGFRELDALTAGIQPGELWLVAAYTGEGKSKTTFNIAYNAAYVQGKNVIFGSAEQTREQVRRNMVCLHSRDPKFGYPRGLRYSDLRMGKLDSEGESILKSVLEDMRLGEYGRMFIFTVPEKSTMSYIAAKVRQESNKHSADLLIVDYLGLLGSRQRRQQRREELDDMLIAAKRLATDANGGKGIPFLSPWQMSRMAWERAVDNGQYTRASLSDTSQAEKSSDLILSLLRTDDPHRLEARILKYRDGEGQLDFHLNTDFATSYVGSDDTLSGLI